MSVVRPVKFFASFFLMSMLVGCSAKSEEITDGTLIVSVLSPHGHLGKPIEIEVEDGRSSAPMRHRHKGRTEFTLALTSGWYHVRCRPIGERQQKAHSVSIQMGASALVSCYFDKGKSPVFRSEVTNKKRRRGKPKALDAREGEVSVGVPESRLARSDKARGAVSELVLGASEVRPQSIHARRRRSAASMRSGSLDANEGLLVQADRIEAEAYGYTPENRFRDVGASPISTFSIDVDTASYSNARRYIEQMGKLPPSSAIRLEEFINYFEYGYAVPQGDEILSTHLEVSSAPWNPKHRLIHIGLKTPKIEMEALPPSNLVFLIDVSGSMNHPNKLPLLKKAFALLVDQMRAKDKVSIVVYASSEGIALPPTSGLEKGKILLALNRLEARGATAGAGGLKLAYQLARDHFIENGNNRIVMATDGDFNVGVSSEGELVKLIGDERDAGIFLSVLGFGRGNYKDDRMEALSNHGNGIAAYIDSLAEARKVLVEQAAGTLLTVAKDVKVQVEFNPEHVSSYRLIGYANRMLVQEDFRDDKKDAGDMGTGHAVTALYEVVPRSGSQKRIAQTLRYRDQKAVPKLRHELLALKVRYKVPKTQEVTEIERVLVDHELTLEQTSPMFRFSAAVAGFGMLLSNSKYRGSCSYASILQLAKDALSEDVHGYRRSFLELVIKAKALSEFSQLRH